MVAVAAVVETRVQDSFGGSGGVIGHTSAVAAAVRGQGRDCGCGSGGLEGGGWGGVSGGGEGHRIGGGWAGQQQHDGGSDGGGGINAVATVVSGAAAKQGRPRPLFMGGEWRRGLWYVGFGGGL